MGEKGEGSHLRAHHVAAIGWDLQDIPAVHTSPGDRFLSGERVDGGDGGTGKRHIAGLHQAVDDSALRGRNWNFGRRRLRLQTTGGEQPEENSEQDSAARHRDGKRRAEGPKMRPQSHERESDEAVGCGLMCRLSCGFPFDFVRVSGNRRETWGAGRRPSQIHM